MRRVAVFVALVILWGQPAVACSCVGFTKPQLVDNAVVIFTGNATSASRPFAFGPICNASSADPVVVTFNVDGVFKGEAPATVTVRTAANGASCGYEFVTGRRYTVFATVGDNGLETNLCRGNVEGAIAPAEYGLPAAHPPKT